MLLDNKIEIDEKIVTDRLKILLNQTYSLLPTREEGKDWQKPLTTLIEEFEGMSLLVQDAATAPMFFSLLCKMKGLFTLDQQEQFFVYRKTIFECINLIEELRKIC